MKYKENGQFKPIYVKALDSMPIGTKVDFDGQASDIPVGWEQIEDKGEIYSTTEQRIGTWIDGKPLYRRVINTTTINSTNNWVDYDFNVYGIPNNLSMLCFKNCYFERTQNNDIVTENYETTGYRLQANLTYNKLSILGTGYSYDRLYMIIEYTKTTDQGGNA